MSQVVKQEKHLYRDELKKMLIIHSISYLIASVLLVVIFIQVYSERTVRKNNHRVNEEASMVIMEELNAYEEAIQAMSEDPVFITYMTEGTNQSEVYRKLYDLINERTIKSMFYFVDLDGRTLLTNNYIESPYNSTDIFYQGLFKQLNARPDEVVILNNKIQIDLTKRTLLSIGKTMQLGDEAVGYLVFDVLESDLNKVIYEADGEMLVLTDRYNNVIVATNALLTDEIGKFNLVRQERGELVFGDQRYYFMIRRLDRGQLNLYTLSDLDFARDILTSSISFIMVTFLILTLVAIKLADYSARKKTISIRNLIGAIGEVQKGNLEAFVPIGRTDEFKLIGEQFNEMLVDLNRLMTRNSELVDRNRLSEIKQLESQFNPHFIFNTLETLKYMIHMDQKKASEIIVNFATILRYSIDYEHQEITLDEDLDYLNSYLVIQKYRYNKRLMYEFDVAGEAKNCVVPKLIMQPVIENCINHGYKSKTMLHINIRIWIEDNELVAVIKDDGDGISKEELVQLQERLISQAKKHGHLGLNNVHRRLVLMYGEPYGMTIESEAGVGTKVTIRMPADR